jgi:hypothetical protein
MYVFLTIEFVLGPLIGIALRASSAERAQLRLWQSPGSASPTAGVTTGSTVVIAGARPVAVRPVRFRLGASQKYLRVTRGEPA